MRNSHIFFFFMVVLVLQVFTLERIYDLLNKEAQIIQIHRPRSAVCTMTAYTNRRCETNNDDFTATMEKPIHGFTCAVSRDLIYWLGGRIYIEGIGIRRVNDLMNKRYTSSVDLYIENVKDALIFGKIKKRVIFLGM